MDSQRRLWSYRITLGMLTFLVSQALYAFLPDQNALYVLGQSNMTSNTGCFSSGQPEGQNSMWDPYDVAFGNTASGNHWAFVTDMKDNRVLAFNVTSSALTNGMPASFQVGQTAWSTHAVNQLQSPTGVAYDSARQLLFVSNSAPEEVVVYDLLAAGGIDNYASWSAPLMPAHILGSPGNLPPGNTIPSNGDSFAQGNGPIYAAPYGPMGLAYDSSNKRLFVTDPANHRVVVWDVTNVSLTNPPVLAVLGQTDEFHGDQNQGYAAPSAGSMYLPTGLVYDSALNRLFVADRGNNRVLMFDLSKGLTTGMNATNVLGQSDPTKAIANWPDVINPTQTGFSTPSGLGWDPNQQRLFVGDSDNQRVLEFDLSGGMRDGMPASQVLGAPSYKDIGPGGPNAAGFYHPYGAIAYDPFAQQLYVPDLQDCRTLIFQDNDINNISNTPLVCGAANTICGLVVKDEDQTPLAGYPMALIDQNGRVIATKKTSASLTAWSSPWGASYVSQGYNGFNFKFGPSDGVQNGQTYYVSPILDRTESLGKSSGFSGTHGTLLFPISNMTISGFSMIESVAGVPGTLTITGAPAGTPILVSTMAYTNATAPAMAVASSFSSIMAGEDGSATVTLPAGTYYVSYWMTQPSGESINYCYKSDGNGHAIQAQQTTTIQAPTTCP